MAAFVPATGERAVVLETARRQIPPVLAVAGLLTLAFGIVNAVVLPEEAAYTWVINAVFGPVFLVLAWLLHRGHLPDAVLPWIWAGCSIALAGMLLQAYALIPTAANLAYLVLVVVAFAPLTHAWPPFVMSAIVIVIGAVAVFSATGSSIEVRENAIVLATGLLVGAVLLHLRLRALGDLATLQLELARQASTDPLTVVRNRHGLDHDSPAFLAAVARSGEPVLAWFVDVRGLKRANDQLGHRFGDELLKAVTRALHTCIRANDLLVRWGGDEFVILGTGAPGSAADLNDRVDRALADDEALAGRWTGSVTVGFASSTGVRDAVALDDLIARADADMYARRSGLDTMVRELRPEEPAARA